VCGSQKLPFFATGVPVSIHYESLILVEINLSTPKMKINFLRHLSILFSLGIALFLANCKNDEDPRPEEPAIVSFSPTSGFPGSTIVITGLHFSTTASENLVSFNNTTEVAATSSTATTLTLMVPDGAVTGKIKVTVNGVSTTSEDDFTVLEPAITSFTPLHGVPGATVTINGSNFSTTEADNTVKFNGTTATVVTASETQLTVTVPAGTTGKITVMHAGRTATSTDDFEMIKDLPRNGLIAFYPFSGNANDASGNSLNGTVYGGAALSTDRFGMTNKSYLFDGTNDYIDVGNPDLLKINGTITVAAWINVNEFKTASNKMMAIMTKYSFGNPNRGYNLSQDFTGNGTPLLTAHIFAPDGQSFTVAQYIGSPVTLDTWMFIAITIDNKTWKFYQDNVLTNEVTSSSVILDDGDGTQGNLQIGAYNNNFTFNGHIDDIAIYNRALTATEIQQLYEQTITKY
jgi:hypothetical protein